MLHALNAPDTVSLTCELHLSNKKILAGLGSRREHRPNDTWANKSQPHSDMRSDWTIRTSPGNTAGLSYSVYGNMTVQAKFCDNMTIIKLLKGA